MKRTVPLLITLLSGVLLIIASFIPYTESWKDDVVVWFDILAAIAFVLGGGNLLMMHLKKMSNRQPGWGYSLVTLVAFLVTLALGFLKIGAPPAVQTERYGETAVDLPLSSFPVTTTVAGTLPPDKLPAVVRGQLGPGAQPDTVTFRGWLTAAQRSKLEDLEYEAAWHKTVAEIYDKAQPPEALRGRVDYQAQLGALNFRGVMSPEDKQALLTLGDNPAWTTAVNQIEATSNEVHAVPLDRLPEGVTIPDPLSAVVTFDAEKKELQIRGPMSIPQREELTNRFPSGTALTQDEKDDLQKKLTDLGPLSPEQIETLQEFNLERPTVGQRNHDLLFELLAAGPLNQAQRELLLAEYNAEAVWRTKVGELFAAAHQVKYPWSGPYDAEGSWFWYIYEFAIWPLTSTMFALLAFYVASAAFRAFRAKNVEASLLLGTAFIILLGRTYAGTVLTGWLPPSLYDLSIPGLSVIIMSVFTTAGNRAIMIGIALGIASTSLKILLGIDRSYLGSDRE